MNHFSRRVGAFFEVSLGLNQMSGEFKKFATMHGTFNLFQGLVSVYVATLLMRVSGDGDIVKWFNVIVYLMTGTMMPVAVTVMRKRSTNLVTRIGIFGFIFFYTVLLFAMNSADKVMPLLGVLNGVSNAFYWITYSSYVSAFTVDSKRDVALAFMGLINGIITLTMPMLSGFVIETIGGIWGYMVAFGLAFLCAVGTILLSLRLPKHIDPAGTKERNTYYRRTLGNIFRNACWKCGMAAEFMRGVREGVFNFLLNVLLFEVVSSETLTGLNTLLVGVGSIISFYLIGRIVKPHNRVKIMLTATILLLCASALPAVALNPVTLISFSFLNAFLTQFILNPSGSIFFLLVQKKAELNAREEYFSLRELMLAIGRVSGILLLFIFPKVQFGYVIAIIVLTMTQFITVGLCRITTKLLEKEEKERETVGEIAESAEAAEA